MAIEVYYAPIPNEDEPVPGLSDILIVTTERSYWDWDHTVSDGGGPNFDRIAHAMEASGAEEVEDSTFALLTGVTVQQLVQNMAKHGFALMTNPAFTRFVNSNS